MSTTEPISRVDRILQDLEHKSSELDSDVAFLNELLESLLLITDGLGTHFVVRMSAPGDFPSPRSAENLRPPVEYDGLIAVAEVGEPLPPQSRSWLAGLSDRDHGSAADPAGRTDVSQAPPETSAQYGGCPISTKRDEDQFQVAMRSEKSGGGLGILLLRMTGDCPRSAERGVVALVEGFGEILVGRLRRREGADRPDSEQWMDPFLADLYAAEDRSELDSILAHDLPKILDCHRVAVLRRRRRWEVTAVTGVVTLSHRTEVVRGLEAVAADMATNQPPGPWLIKAPGNVTLMEAANVDESSPDTLVLPWRGHGRPGKDVSGAETSGVVIIQWNDPAKIPTRLGPLRRVLAHLAHATDQLERRLPWWRRWGKPVLSRRALRSAIKVAAAAVAAGALWWGACLPADFDIEASGRLEPIEQRSVFATHDGSVEQVLAEEGTQVAAGAPLVRLRSPDLELRLEELVGELAATVKRRDGLRVAINQLNAGQRDSADMARQLAAEIDSLDERLRGLARLRELVEREQKSLTILSPIAGEVVSWDTRRQLDSRPVRRGDVLLRVAEIDGPWRLRLWVPDRELAHVAGSHRPVPPSDCDNESKTPPRSVTYKVLSRPWQRYQGCLISVGTSVQQRDALGPAVPIDVAVDPGDVSDFAFGATAIARVHCGQRPWWYVWSRQVIETLQRRFWITGQE